MYTPVEETFSPDGEKTILLLAIYTSMSGVSRHQAALKYGKSKWDVIMQQVEQMANYLFGVPCNNLSQARIPYVVKWPWGGEERLERYKIRMIVENQEVIKSWVNSQKEMANATAEK